MLSLLCLFFVYTLGKQNFQVVGLNGVTTAQALATCQTAGLCTTTTGCCNGHGVCKANLTVASCTCGVPQDCRPGLSQNAYPSYTGTTCNTVAIDSGCCKDGSDDHLYAASGVCNKRNTGDAETGAKGRLLQRLGNASYADGYGSFQDSLSQISSWQTDLLTGNVSYSRFNMMGLGFLQLALKDIVHLDYYPISEQNVTFNGTTYPKIRWQNNTGVSGSPKQFENVATAIVDLGPLYDYATKVGYGPYITATPAVTYWTNTHHMTNEFILALKYFGLYHNYVAANVEDYFCGAHSTNTSTHGNTCTISVAKQYDLARRSTILFFQNLVQQGPLFFALENPTDWFGTEDSFFFTFFLRDRDDTPWGYGPATTYDKVRTGMEFSDGITSASSQHHAISALDFFISARNPNINTTAFALFGSSAPCGYDPATITFPGGSSPAQILQDVVNYFHTKTQRWGSKIHSAYAAETALLLYRANELGLNSYKNVLSYLTDSVSSTDLSTNVNVFYGIHKDTNSARKWRSTTPFVAIAANIVAISDITLHDRTGYWAVDSNTLWGLYQFHPDSSLIAQPDYEFANCYKGGGSTCTTQAWRGAQMLTGQFPLDPNFDSSWYSNIPQYMSRGALNGKPADLVYPHDQDQNSKPAMGWPLISEFVHPLFYHYDGANSMAFRFADQTTYFLPNVIMDAFPSYIAYSNNWDGFCFQQTFVQGNAQYPACSRARTTANGGECWNFPYPVY